MRVSRVEEACARGGDAGDECSSAQSAVLHPSCVKIANFGDRLTPLLLNAALGPRATIADPVGVEENSDGIKVFAIGSFLGRDMLERLQTSGPFIILGAGAGYSDFPIVRTYGLGRKFPARVGNALTFPLPQQTRAIGPRHRIYWVRGPLTAQLLGLGEDVALCDAGYMIRMSAYFLSNQRKNDGPSVAFMPHVTAASNVDYLPSLCVDIGISYIDPRDPVEKILTSIAGSKLLLTEALHGAVIADAHRIPWIPLKSSYDIFEFKWRDYCASIGIEYEPMPIRVRWNVHNFTGRNPRSMAKYLMNRVRSGIERHRVSPKDTAYDLLLAMSRRPQLSADRVIDRLDSEISRRVDLLVRDLERGTVFERGLKS